MTDLTKIFGPQGFDAAKYGAPAPGRSSLAAYAQLYASRKWQVLPLHGITEGHCTCNRADCRTPGKHPRTARGLKDATIDPGIIAAWWTTWPDANIGIATGRESGFWVLDIDPRNGGEQSHSELSDVLGGLPETVMALTGGGGQHLLFEYPEQGLRGGANKLGPGLDVKADGGYIVVEPSVHISGCNYYWEASLDPLEGVAIMPAPALVQRLAAASPAPMTPAAGDVVLPPYKVAEIRSALTHIAADDRDMWLHVAMALHSTEAGQQAFGLWCEWAQSSPKYDAADQRRVWDSLQRDAGGLTLSTLFGYAKQRGWTEAGGSWTGGMPVPSTQSVATTGFQFIPYTELAADPQPPEWLVTDFIERNTLSILYGDSDAYKSFIALDIGLNVAAGLPWHGRATLSGAVFYICGEGHRGVGRRVAAWQRQNQVGANLPFFASRTSAELTAFASAQAVSDACAEISASQNRDPVLIIIDTLAANFGGADENSTKDMNMFLTMVTRLLRERFGAAVMVVHHVGHGSKDRERGAYALRGNADARIRVERTNDLQTVLYCEKTKDAERWEPLRMDLVVVPLGILDSEGRTVTSLAVTAAVTDQHAKPTKHQPTERTNKSPPNRTGKGINQQIMLRELHRMYLEYARNITDGRKARVTTKHWRESVCDTWDIERRRFFEVLARVKEQGLVTIEGPHVELTSAGLESLQIDD